MNPAPRKSFDANGIQFAFDSTSLKLFLECPRKYKLKMLDGWTSRRVSVHLKFGGWYASALEEYYKLIAFGYSSDEALFEIVRDALIASWEYTLDESGEKVSVGPWTSDHNTKTRENLIRTIIWYVDQFENESIKVIMTSEGKPAVEYSFALPVDDGIVFSGHIDRLVEYSDAPYVMDQKTTGTTITPYYFDGFKPDVQMSMYTFAGRMIYNMPVKGVIIDAAQIAVGFTRFARGFTHRTESELNEWYDETMATAHRIRQSTRDNIFPANPTACGNYGGCEFRSICSRSPEVRPQFLAGDFVQGKLWDPLESR